MDGIIIINKPKNYTSHDIVRKAKKLLNEKVGHTGTLDPNATGVLPLLIGKGTQISKYIINHDKVYEAVLQLGTKTDTADVEGKIIEEKTVTERALEKENIEKVLEELTGEQEQIPPMYSAIKINGKKLYEYARNGMKVEIPKREIEIYNIKLIKLDKNEKEIEFEVECSKGTYIRTLCEDIAKKLDTIGYMKSLTRTKVNNFKLEDTITFEDLENNKNNEEWLLHNSYTMEEIFDYLPKLELNDRKKELFLNGVQLTFKEKDGLYNIYNNENYLGTGTIKNELLKRDIIILQN